MGTAVVELSKEQKKLYKAIGKATESATGYLMVERNDDLEALVAAKSVDVNEAIQEGNQVAVRLRDEVSQTNGAATGVDVTEIQTQTESNSGVLFISGIPMAEAKRGGKKEEKYPFSKMGIADSFLVAATDKYPEPWKTFASTVSSASRRFKADGKKFTLRRVTKGDTYPNGYVEPNSGARVFRTA